MSMHARGCVHTGRFVTALQAIKLNKWQAALQGLQYTMQSGEPKHASTPRHMMAVTNDSLLGEILAFGVKALATTHMPLSSSCNCTAVAGSYTMSAACLADGLPYLTLIVRAAVSTDVQGAGGTRRRSLQERQAWATDLQQGLQAALLQDVAPGDSAGSGKAKAAPHLQRSAAPRSVEVQLK